MAEILCPQCKAPNRETAQFCAECGTPLLRGTASRPDDQTLITRSPLKPPEAAAPKILQNRYRIEAPLGQGGFGSVYRAWDLNLERPCAIKENLTTSAESQRQFMREATVLSNLSHPNLPRVIDHFIIPDQGQYLVMDFVDGGDLESLLERRELIPLEEAAGWVLQVAEALSYLHRQKPPIFHRDIKPANIRLTPAGQVMLVDFGLVKVFDPFLNTTQGARAVTPGYAPPEQYGRGNTDARSDLYALGATFYALLTGHEPLESVRRMAGERLPPAHELNPYVPLPVSKVIERLMSLEPANRYANAAEFQTALRLAMTEAAQAPQAPPMDPTLISPMTATGVRAALQEAARPPAEQKAPSAPQVAATRAVSAPLDPTRRMDTEAVSTQAPFAPGPQGWAPEAPAQRVPSSRRKWLIVAGIGLLAVVCLAVAGTLASLLLGDGDGEDPVDETLTAHARLEQPIQATLTARARERVTPSAIVGGAATLQASATTAGRSQGSPIATAAATQAEETATPARAGGTEQARSAYLAGMEAKSKLAFGPRSGRILHKAQSSDIQFISASVGARNFISEVEFVSPYSPEDGDWDFGLLFRDSGNFVQYRLIFFSDGSWYLASYIGTPDETELASGELASLRTEAGESNKIRLYVIEDRGWVFVNDEFLTEFDASQHYSGGISIGIGFFEGYGITGKLTEYKNFTVWTLPSNP